MLTIDYYTDVLCVWAWIAEPRVQELQKQFGSDIRIVDRYIDVFGNTAHKLQQQWSQRGGQPAFAEHVQEAVQGHESAPVNPDNWVTNTPTTSASAHLHIKAVALTMGVAAARNFTRALREAFFIDGRDISHAHTLAGLIESCDLDSAAVNAALHDGSAMAALMSDYQAARSLHLRGSPSYVMNNERQILYGNVGYRVLSANVEELLREVPHEASWC
ncbi:MAG: DsbA family protein [Gammaproteobacteria bacterium]|nr:DsbA family protein [Gammaproteobacteria bacterium]